MIGFGLIVHGADGQWSLTAADAPRVVTFIIISLLLAALSLSRDRAEAALRASERHFRTMLETANEGVWQIDREGRTQYANARMATLLGTTPENLKAKTVLDFVFPEDVSAARDRIAANLAGRSEEFDFRFRRTDGKKFSVLAGTSPSTRSAGRIAGALGFFTDVTLRRRAEAASGSSMNLAAPWPPRSITRRRCNAWPGWPCRQWPTAVSSICLTNGGRSVASPSPLPTPSPGALREGVSSSDPVTGRTGQRGHPVRKVPFYRATS